MTVKVTIHEARTQLSRLLEQVADRRFPARESALSRARVGAFACASRGQSTSSLLTTSTSGP